MKKIALALVLALGCANVYADVTVAPVAPKAGAVEKFDTEVKRSVEALKLSKADQNIALAWIKKHPVIVGTIAATALVAILGGVSYYMSQSTTVKGTNGAADVVTPSKHNWMVSIWSVYQKAFTPVTWTKDQLVKGKNLVVAHPYITAGSALGVIAIAAAIYDIAARGEKSTLKALWKNATAAANKAQAEAPAQPAVV